MLDNKTELKKYKYMKILNKSENIEFLNFVFFY